MQENEQRGSQKHTGIKSGGFIFLCALSAGAAVWLLASMLWEQRRWSDLTMEELMGQVLAGMTGSSHALVMEHLLFCVLPGAAAAAAAALLLLRQPRQRRRTIAKRCSLLGLAGISIVLVYACATLDIVTYAINANTASDYIEDNYADPQQVTLTFPEQKRNLIFIWLESMESSYADQANGGAFDQNRIPELTRLAEQNTSFTGTQGGVNGGYSLAGATWTAGALFAQTSGLPLKIPIANSSMSDQQHFFPGATTLGDILQQNGYQQALLIGSDATFGGRRLYFTEHGDYTMWDYVYSQQTGQIPEDYYVWWGYEDAKLFDFAKQHLLELAQDGLPFNLSLLTVDTHFPDGYPCALCGDEFDDQYSNVIACSSRQVAAFVEWVQQQPFYENTTIILAGDHVTMDVNCSELIGDEYARRTYTTIINPAAEVADPDQYRDYTTFDIFPTTLAAMGVQIEGDQLGLGVNLFSGKQTLLERDGVDKMTQELKRQSDFIDALSGISTEVYDISEAFQSLDTALDVTFSPDTLTYTLHNLQPMEEEFSEVEVFADIMSGETKITLASQVAAKQPDGSYQAVIPVDALDGQNEFVVHIFAMTSNGRMMVGKTYTCNIAEQRLE